MNSVRAGLTALEAQISESGCVESASVLQSSGDEALDEAALLWTERAKFLPAVKDGKPAAGSMSFRVKFELKD